MMKWVTIIISTVSLFVSLLTYRNSTYKPDLKIDASGKQETTRTKSNKPQVYNLIEIILTNTGKAAAKNIRLTLWNMHSVNPKASLGPEKAYTVSTSSGKFSMTLPIIGAGRQQTICISDKIQDSFKYSEINNTYFMNVDCDEGVDKTMIFLVTGPAVKYSCVECHNYDIFK
jgi:hypothetical protein